jgi:hypothetical protein
MRTEEVQLYTGTVITNGNSYDHPIEVRNAGEVVLFLDVTAVSGTNPSLTIYLMTQDTISGKWFLVGNFTPKTSAGTDITYIINGLGSYIACAWTVAGIDPSFDFALNASIKA